jgi:ATP-dependent DNA helicase PIF1
MRQKQALQVMQSGNSVFLTGAPGAGKTYVLNDFIKRMQRLHKNVAVTASTGIAATHIGGTTIHSWSGLGIRDSLSDWDRDRLKENDRLIKRYNAADILVIDEVSMLHGRRLDMVNEVSKLLRKSEEPFGGIQVIMVGELFQLPPVSRGSEPLDFVHNSAAWAELNPRVCYLSEQHRQVGGGLLDMLEAMRCGEVNEMHESMLGERLGKKPSEDVAITRLYAHNVDVETINQKHLAVLNSETKLYTMQTKGAAAKVEQLVKNVLAPEELELKIGAEIMFVANNFAAGFVNGSRGRVVDFVDSLPLVELTNGRSLKVEYHSWSLVEDGRTRAEVTQLPLRLAWAITIHKSQGMSLDAAEIDLSRTFTPGMGYVALSRVRSLEGVYLNGINQMALAMSPEIYEFDELLRRSSETLAAITADIADEDEAQQTAEYHELDDALLAKLKLWRMKRAQTEHVPAYIIAHDSVLEAMAANPPRTAQSLLGLKGFGPKKFEAYGNELIRLISEHTGQAIKVSPSETPSSWSKAEDKELVKCFKAHQSLAQVAKVLNRDPPEIWQRISELLSQ